MSTRSGSSYSVPRDANRVPFLVAASTADGVTPVVLEADPTTHALVTSGGGGGGSTSAVDPNNSTTTPLAANGVFTGTGTSCLNAAAIEVIMYSNVASAASGLSVQFSSDNINWDDSATYTFTPGSVGPNQGQTFITSARAEYYRVVYTNGSTLQTTFRLESVLKAQTINGAVIALGSTVSDTNHAQLTQSVIVGKTTGGGGGFVTVKVNPSGALTVETTLTASALTIGNTGTPSATINIGQTTSAVTATQLTASSIAMTNGVVIQALSSNITSVYIGNSSVTTANGFELTAGSSLTISPSNINLVYVIGANATDKVCWSVT